MPTRHCSFLIRHWQLADGARRIVVEHVQSGEQATLPTLEAATAWLAARTDDEALPGNDGPRAASEHRADKGTP